MRLQEAAAALAIAAAFMVLGARLQQPTDVVLWDAHQYYGMASGLAAGRPAYAEVPYVYRIGVPWLVSRLTPADPRRGFMLVNGVAALAIAVLLDLWLCRWLADWRIRLALVALFAAAWHGPVRYLFFNPGYVDPPFLACLLAGVILIGSLAERFSLRTLIACAVVTLLGTLVRETMALVGIACLFVDNPVGRWTTRARSGRGLPLALKAAPLVVSLAVIVWTHAIVAVDSTERSFAGAVLQYLRKSPLSYALAWFTAFGPVLAIPLFDWRGARRDLIEHEWLAALLALCAGMAFIGGSDTERFVFWSLPVVYVLIGRTVERHRGVFAHARLAAALVVLQTISARVFWGIPDPALDSVALAGQSWSARAFGVLDRLLVIDGFHWNLWSSFGSRPFKLARLALYLAVTGTLVHAMRVRARHQAAAT